MSQQEYQGYHSAHEEASFNDVLMEQIRNTPWLIISVVVHVVLGLILNALSTDSTGKTEVRPIEASADSLDQLEEPETEEVEEETEELEPEEEITEEPVIKDTEISDHNETDNDEEFEESKGEEDALNDKPFDANQANDAIGIGGGGGSAFGGRRGGRRNLRARGGGFCHSVAGDRIGGQSQHLVDQHLGGLVVAHDRARRRTLEFARDLNDLRHEEGLTALTAWHERVSSRPSASA